MIYDGEKFYLAEKNINDVFEKLMEIKDTLIRISFLDMQDFDDKQSIIEACNNILNVYDSLESLSSLVKNAKNRISSLDCAFISGYKTAFFRDNLLNHSFVNKNETDFLAFQTDYIKFDSKSLKEFINEYIDKNPELSTMANSNEIILEKKLNEVANWYIGNVSTYQRSPAGQKGTDERKYYKTPFGNKLRGDDCTEFAGLYMSYVCGTELDESYSGEMVNPYGDWAKNAEKSGWKAYSTADVEELKTGDVLVAYKDASYKTNTGVITSSKGKHAEVYLNEGETFGWGSVQSVYPSKRNIEKIEVNGQIHYQDSNHDYITIYRYEGDLKE